MGVLIEIWVYKQVATDGRYYRAKERTLMPKGIPLTEEQQQQRRKEIFDASVHLFLEKGFNRNLDARDSQSRWCWQINFI